MYAIEYSRKINGQKIGVFSNTFGDKKEAERKAAKMNKNGGGFSYRVIEL